MTAHGAEALRLLGIWYRAHYAGIFTDDSCGSRTVYAEANTAQRTVASAKAFLAGLQPGCEPQVGVKANGETNPLFGPGEAGELADSVMLSNAIRGRLGGRTDWWTNVFAEPLEEMQHVLLDCAGVDCNKSKRLCSQRLRSSIRRRAVVS